ncbi:hypothetical protein PC129_g7093 [Phytophthora cactorum]|uniref:Uncharacterized protein n=1 Tax=Phytophthora cactorum TaxID=29920 RepID=A0A329S894_9STRA|nr:hypothetical protein PC113_g7184 [Phytophthora cactorum]KAG2929331.1 hypothetical protein PC115_g6909 [Phytophthora cactorum]KAG3068180.1 hypothetical protein PC121_g10290 [Phytophthora cactorum]KAG3222193.1 hypothetical protein PC129_g7093 [Phytophthora cactorum]RAW33134.1 hypothetical protein PC110_g10543 [Phytophthora cactorum]
MNTSSTTAWITNNKFDQEVMEEIGVVHLNHVSASFVTSPMVSMVGSVASQKNIKKNVMERQHSTKE